MTTESALVPLRMRAGRAPRGARWLASIALFGVLPLVMLTTLLATAIGDGVASIDFRQFYRAAEAVLAGDSPYSPAVSRFALDEGPYAYPPLPALLTVPLTVLPPGVADVLVMCLLVAVALAVPYVLGVRDWRCYGLVLLWPPVISATQTGNVTLLMALATALAWRWRDRPWSAGSSIGAAFASKLIIWPLALWLVATRRFAAAAVALAVGGGLLVLSFAVIGFAALREYVDVARGIERAYGDYTHTIPTLAVDLGASADVALAIWVGVGTSLAGAALLVGLRGREQSAFILSIAVVLAVSPILWLHYFALLLVVASVAQPRLGYVWFVPLAMYLSRGNGDPTPFETGVVLTAAAVTLGLSLLALETRQRFLRTEAIASRSA